MNEKKKESSSKEKSKKSNSLKILAVGDLHGDKEKSKELAEKAKKEGVDLVIFTGDFTFFETDTEGLIGPFVEKGLKVILIPGNHETIATTDFLASLYGGKNLHGYAMIYKGIGFVGIGGSTVGPNTQLSEKEIWEIIKSGFQQLEKLKKYSKLEKTVLVSHTHPAGTLMEKLTDFFKGSKSIRKAIEYFKPDLFICSHVHEAEGIEEIIGETKLINVGRSGKIIEIPVEEKNKNNKQKVVKRNKKEKSS